MQPELRRRSPALSASAVTQRNEKADSSQRQFPVELTRQQVKDSPEYDPSMTVDRIYEEHLHRYYNRPRYWV